MNSGTKDKTAISTTDTVKQSASGNYRWVINRICSAKYSPIQMRFINKNGAPQDHYFFLKNVENINTKSETFKRNIFTYSSSNYDAKQHQMQTFNKTGKKRFTLNTNYMIEAYNAVMEDILLSEYVWIYFDSNWHPVVVVTSSLLKKTSVNDKLIQYTLEVEDANDIINNICIMKRELQLYIQNTRVDLFKDETVSLTDSIQNVKDIAKIFTTFTKTFTLPASSTNNKLFKHYYNFDILDTTLTKSAFDARKKLQQESN